MKKHLFILLALSLGFSSNAFAADRDLGGKTITIANYNNIVEPDEKFTTYEEVLWEYRHELMDTHNFTFEQKGLGTWDTMLELFATSSLSGNPAAEIFRMDPRFTIAAMNSGLCYDLATLDSIDIENPMWLDTTEEMMTRDDSVYGVFTTFAPRRLLFFNKRLFEEAGLDPNLPYDLQASGEWTWEAFEEISQKLTRDIDNDGLTDVHAMVFDHAKFFSMAVLSNGGSFVEKNEDDMFYNNLSSPETMEALEWAAAYAQKNYEIFPTNWKGQTAMFINAQAAMVIADDWETATIKNMDDDYGVVLFPKGPNATEHVVFTQDSAWVIPNTYSKAEAEDIAFALKMWMALPPEYDDPDAWRLASYANYRDDRAVDETLALAREPGVAKVDYSTVIGSAVNTNLFINKIYINGLTPVESVEAINAVWQAELDKVNGVPGIVAPK